MVIKRRNSVVGHAFVGLTVLAISVPIKGSFAGTTDRASDSIVGLDGGRHVTVFPLPLFLIKLGCHSGGLERIDDLLPLS